MVKIDKLLPMALLMVMFLGLLFISVDRAHAESENIPGVTTEMVDINTDKHISSSALSASNEAAAAADAHEDEPSLHVGGAVRYNLLLESYESDIDGNSGDFTWDMWAITAQYDNPGGISLNFEYRFYPTFDTHFIKQGWLEYDFTDEWQAQLGVTQVPFGNLGFNSNSWWFQLPYYLGYEDDHDIGLKLTQTTDTYRFDVAYFFSQEPHGPSPFTDHQLDGTYSYNVNPHGNSSLEERNHFNVRGEYFLDMGSIGASAEFGQLYNNNPGAANFEETHSKFALAGHADLNIGAINLKPQVLYYNWDAEDDDGNEVETVGMGAYGFSTYDVATEAYIASLGISRNVSVDWGPITDLTFYNDFSYMGKMVGEDTVGDDFEATIHNITGFLITAGPIFTYVDVAQGVNQPWLTDDFGVGLGPGHEDLGMGDSEYNMRFNINIGYYF